MTQHLHIPTAADRDPQLEAIDRASIRRLRNLKSPARSGFLAELVRQFEHNTGELVERMRVAHASGDAAALRGAAHSLAGAGFNIGAVRLSGLCGDLEQLAHGRPLTTLGAQLDAVQRELRAVLEALRDEAAGG